MTLQSLRICLLITFSLDDVVARDNPVRKSGSPSTYHPLTFDTLCQQSSSHYLWHRSESKNHALVHRFQFPEDRSNLTSSKCQSCCFLFDPVIIFKSVSFLTRQCATCNCRFKSLVILVMILPTVLCLTDNSSESTHK